MYADRHFDRSDEELLEFERAGQVVCAADDFFRDGNAVDGIVLDVVRPQNFVPIQPTERVMLIKTK